MNDSILWKKKIIGVVNLKKPLLKITDKKRGHKFGMKRQRNV